MKKKHKVIKLFKELDNGGENHLYILSDEEIKEGSIVYDPIIQKVFTAEAGVLGLPNKVFKVIATTDKALKYTDHRISPVPNFCDFPQIPHSFIESYVKNPVEEVELVYELGDMIRKQMFGNIDNSPQKLDLTANNEVIIFTPEPKMYSKLEVQELIYKATLIDNDEFHFFLWIKENL